MHSLLFGAALQNRLTAKLCPCSYACGHLLFMQVCRTTTNALQDWSGQTLFPTVQCCSAQKAHSRLDSPRLHLWTFVDLSYRCAVTQHQGTATLVKANCIPDSSVLLCKTGSQQACVTASAPIDICCSYRCAVTQHQCIAQCCFAKQVHSRHCVPAITLLDMCCSYRCKDPTPIHCSTGLAKFIAHCSVLLC